MLRTLDIKNAGLVQELRVEFVPGLCIITGETGAGKSMIVGSIELILGDRADVKIIRTGQTVAEVSAVFDVAAIGSVSGILDRYGIAPEEDGALLISRQISGGGKSRCYINGRPATVTMLKEIGEALVDIHSQNSHQSLLKRSSHLELLDAYGALERSRTDFAGLFKQFRNLREEYEELFSDEREREQQIDLYRFQMDEIQKARLRPDEEEELKKERDLLQNAETIAESITAASKALDGNENSTASSLHTALQHLDNLSRIAADFGSEYQQLKEAVLGVEDVVEKLGRHSERLEFDPQRLERIESRLHQIFLLKKKYGNSIGEILEHLEEVSRKLERYENRDQEIEKLRFAVDQMEKKMGQEAAKISRLRKKVAAQLSDKIEAELKQLGIVHCRFVVEVGKAELSSTGADRVEFLISPNPGEPLKPLKEIASSGEISRVMLAIKSVLAEKDTIPILIFDEIDVNIGGRTASTVGKKLTSLAKSHQVLCITHLPQVAAEADAHYLVSKSVSENRTCSTIAQLDKKQRVKEITRMFGGDSTRLSTQYAQKILKHG